VSRSSREPMKSDGKDFRRSEFAEPNSAAIVESGNVFGRAGCSGSNGQAMEI
jgi:hypothetical protein